ncbi:MAG TPA: hypothetical protein VGJ44_09090 [Kribbellaceae bacterium]
MSDQDSTDTPPAAARNIEIRLSERATLKAVRTDGGFDILVGDDVVIRGVTPDHMRSLVGSVMDAYVPAEMASRLLNSRATRLRRRSAAPAERDDAEG